MNETVRKVAQVGAACAASVAGIMFGASESPQEVRAQSCENNYCAFVDPLLGWWTCQYTSSSSGCNMTGNWRCESSGCGS